MQRKRPAAQQEPYAFQKRSCKRQFEFNKQVAELMDDDEFLSYNNSEAPANDSAGCVCGLGCPCVTPSKSVRLKGHLRKHISFWRKIGASSFVLNIIKKMVTISLLSKSCVADTGHTIHFLYIVCRSENIKSLEPHQEFAQLCSV